jgi:hypothetical protein
VPVEPYVLLEHAWPDPVVGPQVEPGGSRRRDEDAAAKALPQIVVVLLGPVDRLLLIDPGLVLAVRECVVHGLGVVLAVGIRACLPNAQGFPGVRCLPLVVVGFALVPSHLVLAGGRDDFQVVGGQPGQAVHIEQPQPARLVDTQELHQGVNVDAAAQVIHAGPLAEG